MQLYTSKPFTSNPIKNDGSTMIAAGTVDTTITSAVSVSGLATPVFPTTPTSGVLQGVIKPTVGNYLYNNDNPVTFTSTTLAGSGNTSLGHGTLDNNDYNPFQQYERYNITAYSASGNATKGVNAGTAVLGSGITGGAAGKLADSEVATAGEFMVMVNGMVPSGFRY